MQPIRALTVLQQIALKQTRFVFVAILYKGYAEYPVMPGTTNGMPGSLDNTEPTFTQLYLTLLS
jgi:hypothetical protein